MRADVVRMYRDIHSWVGIVCGLFLFTAFYAGAITMFAEPLDRWASPPVALSPPPSLADTPALIQKTLAAVPAARRQYQIVLEPDAAAPARMLWYAQAPAPEERGGGQLAASSLGPDGGLQTAELKKGDVANFVDVLHQRLALPLDREIGLPVMGIVALLYAVALISGVIVLLPSLVKDLFALRLGRNLKRMWLDVHNVLGVFSLPFHIVMALTSVIFAFHDQIYATQDVALYGGRLEKMWDRPVVSAHPPTTPLMPPAAIVARLGTEAPGFAPERLIYRTVPGNRNVLAVWGHDDRYPMRAATQGFVSVDPYDGTILDDTYLPGRASGMMGAVINFFSLHFGSFGGMPVRWGYFALGLAGAFLFYTGNLLWVASRRQRERAQGESRPTRILDRLTLGWCLGTMAGISATIAAAKLLEGHVADPALWHRIVFYAVLVGALGWTQLRDASQARREMLWLAGFGFALIPVASMAAACSGTGWNDGWPVMLVDLVAGAGAGLCLWMAYLQARHPASLPTVPGATQATP